MDQSIFRSNWLKITKDQWDFNNTNVQRQLYITILRLILNNDKVVPNPDKPA